MKKFINIFVATVFLFGNAFAEKLNNNPKKTAMIDRIQIDDDRTATLIGEVTNGSTTATNKQLETLDAANNKPIYLIIDSVGGSVVAGMTTVDVIKELKSPLVCVIDHKAYSMGAIIASYCPKLYIHRHANILFHQASYGLEGNETEIRVRTAMEQKQLESIDREVAENLGITLADFETRKHAEWWIQDDEAVQLGFCTAAVNHLKYMLPVETLDFTELLKRLFKSSAPVKAQP